MNSSWKKLRHTLLGIDEKDQFFSSPEAQQHQDARNGLKVTPNWQ